MEGQIHLGCTAGQPGVQADASVEAVFDTIYSLSILHMNKEVGMRDHVRQHRTEFGASQPSGTLLCTWSDLKKVTQSLEQSLLPIEGVCWHHMILK